MIQIFGITINSSLLAWILIGLLAGWIAGLIGSVLGGWIFSHLQILGGGFIYGLAAATVGAVVLVSIARLFAGGRGRR